MADWSDGLRTIAWTGPGDKGTTRDGYALELFYARRLREVLIELRREGPEGRIVAFGRARTFPQAAVEAERLVRDERERRHG